MLFVEVTSHNCPSLSNRNVICDSLDHRKIVRHEHDRCAHGHSEIT